jgi:hypothetical protein
MFNINETLTLIKQLQEKIAFHQEELKKFQENLERLKKTAAQTQKTTQP